MVGKHVMTLRFPLCAVGQMELRCDGRMFLSHYLDSRPGCGASEMREEGQVALSPLLFCTVGVVLAPVSVAV